MTLMMEGSALKKPIMSSFHFPPTRVVSTAVLTLGSCAVSTGRMCIVPLHDIAIIPGAITAFGIGNYLCVIFLIHCQFAFSRDLSTAKFARPAPMYSPVGCDTRYKIRDT